jgi:hypothetical protein
MKDLRTKIQDDDCIISDSRNGYIVKCELDNLGEFLEMDECLDAINNWMKRNNFYPNIYFINDHGNIHLINLQGKIIQSQV